MNLRFAILPGVLIFFLLSLTIFFVVSCKNVKRAKTTTQNPLNTGLLLTKKTNKLNPPGAHNTILIIADDLSPDYLGFYKDAKDTAHVPNIRKLLGNGVLFTKAWSYPYCSIARASMLTGRYPFRTGVGYVITTKNNVPELDTSEISVATMLKNYAPENYNTACIGKWHMHRPDSTKFRFPNVMGFDLYSGNFGGDWSNYYHYERIKNGISDTVNTYATTQTVNDAIAWMDTMNTSKPFFLWLAFNAPHFPFHLPPANLITNASLSGSSDDIKAHPKLYFEAAIEAMDCEIGRFFDYLDANNLRDNTTIIFIGDNGNDHRTAQIADSQNAKGTCYDYGVNVPLIISGPDIINPNRVSDALVNATDLFATISELSGIKNWINFIPASKLPVDSKSLLPILKNQTDHIRNWNFTEEFKTPSDAKCGKAIRNLNYQLIHFDNGNEEYYNLVLDTFEQRNLLAGKLTDTDIRNYHALCDTLSTLTGTNNCKTIPEISVSILRFTKTDLRVQIHAALHKTNFTLLDHSGHKIEHWSSIDTDTNDVFRLPIHNKLKEGIYFLQLQNEKINYSLKLFQTGSF